MASALYIGNWIQSEAQLGGNTIDERQISCKTFPNQKLKCTAMHTNMDLEEYTVNGKSITNKGSGWGTNPDVSGEYIADGTIKWSIGGSLFTTWKRPGTY